MNGERWVVLRSSPRVWPRTPKRPGVRGQGVWPVGLTAREEGNAPTGLAGSTRQVPNGSRLIGPHKRTVPSSEQKLCIDQCTEQRIASGPVEAPEPLCLRRRQPQSGHLGVFALDASQYVVKRLLCWHLRGSPIPNLSSRCREKSNAHATALHAERLMDVASDRSRNRAH